MKTKPVIAILLFIIAAGLLIWWIAMGHQMWTTTAHMVEVKDELFGTVSQTWEPYLTPGLMPLSDLQSGSTAGVAPSLLGRLLGLTGIGSLVVICGGLGWLMLRKGKQPKISI